MWFARQSSAYQSSFARSFCCVTWKMRLTGRLPKYCRSRSEPLCRAWPEPERRSARHSEILIKRPSAEGSEAYGNCHRVSHLERSNLATAALPGGADFGDRGRRCVAEDSAAAFLFGRI